MSNSDLVPSDSLPDLAQAPSFIIRAPGQPGRWKMGEEDTLCNTWLLSLDHVICSVASVLVLQEMPVDAEQDSCLEAFA
eukprot:1138905-Pelagomonas_calceolata.AAC.3